MATAPPIESLLLLAVPMATAPPVSTRVPARGCGACAAVANELERQMHVEWGHLHLTLRDRKRKLAAEMLREQACSEATQTMLRDICTVVHEYAVGHTAAGVRYWQKVNHAEEGTIVISGTVEVAGGDDSLSMYCEHLVAKHEEALTHMIADGTDDLVGDLCIRTTHECTAEIIQSIPREGLPWERTLPK